jgi:hypothetical protein
VFVSCPKKVFSFHFDALLAENRFPNENFVGCFSFSIVLISRKILALKQLKKSHRKFVLFAFLHLIRKGGEAFLRCCPKSSLKFTLCECCTLVDERLILTEKVLFEDMKMITI